jgi:phenylacetic acid degradation operon negative regulatory protein
VTPGGHTQGRKIPLASFRAVITDAPVSYSVYSSFSFYGARRGGELPGTWLVAALGSLGHEVAAVRQTLYRLEGSRELDSRTAGRTKFYRLTPGAMATAQAGLAKIMGEAEPEWDGRWTLVLLRAGSDESVERERLREVLQSEGFAAIGGGLYIHPRDRSRRVLDAARGHDALELIETFRGARAPGRPDREFVAQHWALDALAAEYARFVTRYEPVLRLRQPLSLEASFVLRFAVVFDYLEVAWRDPDLVSTLLPAGWAGFRARRIARALYERLLPGALSFSDAVMRDVVR